MVPVIAGGCKEVVLKKTRRHWWLVGRLPNESCDDAATVCCRQRLKTGSDLCNGLFPGGIAVAVSERFKPSIAIVVKT